MKQHTTPWQRRQGIPDAQVRDAADQYEAARKLLAVQPPGSGVLLPMMNAAAVAIELYLKSLSAELVHTPVDDVSGVSLVTAAPGLKGHSPTALFDRIPDELRSDFERAGQAEFRGLEVVSFREVLHQCEGAFAASRYPFELGTNISKYPLGVLLRCSEFLAKYVANVEPREYILWR